MTDKSAAELELDAEAARAQVADTAESIRSKMSPGQLIDEFAGLFTGGDGAATLTTLKAQVRDNPLPLTLVGAGLAWLMLGGGTSAGESSYNDRGARRSRDNSGSQFRSGKSQTGFGEYLGSGGSTGSQQDNSSLVTSALDSATTFAEGVVDAGKSAIDSATGAVTDAGGRLAGTTSEMGSNVGEMTQRARQSAQEVFQREPLVLAALGLAVGTAIGAMLPSTTLEDEQLGRYRDKLRDSAEDLLDKGVEGAKEVAAEAYETIKDEADQQGLKASGDSSVVEQVGKVVKSAAAKTEKSVREKITPKSRE